MPCLLQALVSLEIMPVESMPEWRFFVLWPGFGFYMASDTGKGPDATAAAMGFALSVLANAIAYGFVGWILSFFLSRFRGPDPHYTPPRNSD